MNNFDEYEEAAEYDSNMYESDYYSNNENNFPEQLDSHRDL